MEWRLKEKDPAFFITSIGLYSVYVIYFICLQQFELHSIFPVLTTAHSLLNILLSLKYHSRMNHRLFMVSMVTKRCKPSLMTSCLVAYMQLVVLQDGLRYVIQCLSWELLYKNTWIGYFYNSSCTNTFWSEVQVMLEDILAYIPGILAKTICDIV